MTRFQKLSRIWEQSAIALGTGLYVGFIPVAPGTFGTLLAVPLAWGLTCLPGGLQPAITVILLIAGVPICGRAAQSLGKEDPGAVVLDEIAAYLLIFLFVPWHPASAVMAFAMFRLFDISKPWPVHRLEMLPKGWGIMADDVAAALYAAGVVRALLWLWTLA